MIGAGADFALAARGSAAVGAHFPVAQVIRENEEDDGRPFRALDLLREVGLGKSSTVRPIVPLKGPSGRGRACWALASTPLSWNMVVTSRASRALSCKVMVMRMDSCPHGYLPLLLLIATLKMGPVSLYLTKSQSIRKVRYCD